MLVCVCVCVCDGLENDYRKFYQFLIVTKRAIPLLSEKSKRSKYLLGEGRNRVLAMTIQNRAWNANLRITNGGGMLRGSGNSGWSLCSQRCGFG